MSKSPWGIGEWAAEAERAEAEEREAAASAASTGGGGGGGGGGGNSFPSLKEAVTTTSKQKKKTRMTLQEFTMQGSFGSSATATRLTPEEMMRLPTGPKERSGEEMYQGRLGGFSNYGTRPGGGPPGRIRDRDQDSEGSWGGGARRGYGGFEDDRRRGPPPSRVSEFEQAPSRADEVDNWASMKRSQPTLDSGAARPGRYASLGGGAGGFSRADEVDNWGAMKKPLPPPPSTAPARSSSFGSGFRSEMRPGPEPERWTKDREGSNQEAQRLVLEQPTVKVNKPNPFGAARPREEVLAEKGVDWKKVDMEIEVKKLAGTSRPTSSHSSRPGSSQSARSEGAALQQQGAGEVPVKPKPKVNPFGDAKPREVLLEEKGLDWRKIDLELEHRRIDRAETDEEKKLKEEIEHLKKESQEKSGEEQVNLCDVIRQKEKDLDLLTRELDDKVRFGQKAVERPGSGAGRYAGPSLRVASQPGGYEEPRGAEFMDRPRSRGTGEPWARPVDDRRGYSGGRDRGFSGSRDFDRSRSRDRW